MKKYCLLLLMINASLVSIEWLPLLEKYYQVIDPDYSFAQGKALAIAAQSIKEIPIQECGEEVINLIMVNHSRIKVMSESELLLAYQCVEDIDPRSQNYSKNASWCV